MGKTAARKGGKPCESSKKNELKSGEKRKERETLKIEGPLMDELLKVNCGRSTMKNLESLIGNVLRILEPHFNLSDKTRTTAELEKQQLKRLLIFLDFSHRDIPEPKCNIDYLPKMSDLLAYYIGIEVLTSPDPFDADSKEGKDFISRIVTILYTSLASSEDHVLDTMLKLRGPLDKDTSKKDMSVYAELLRIVVKKARKLQENDLTYLRYVLVYRMLKRMMKMEEKPKARLVVEQASKWLKPPPGFVQRFAGLPDILSCPPENTRNITAFFLRTKCNIQETIKKFLDETSKPAYHSAMFSNLSCDPQLLNLDTRESEPLPPLNVPIQESSTYMNSSGDTWLQEASHSESVLQKVTSLDNVPTCTTSRVFNLLHSHHFQRQARKVESKKRALQEAFFQDVFSPKADSRRSANAKTSDKIHRRRAIELPESRMSKKFKLEEGRVRDQPAKSSTSENLLGESSLERQNVEADGYFAVKAEVKEEPNGSSCSSSQSLDGDPPAKLAIEREVEQTLKMLQKSKSIEDQPSPSFDSSPVKSEGLPDSTTGSETPNRSRSEAAPDWSSMWEAMSYVQPQEMTSGDDIWLDDLMSSLTRVYPSSNCPEGQDFWSLIASDEIAWS